MNSTAPDRLNFSYPFLICAVIASIAFVTANVVAVKLVDIRGFVIPGGALVYPLTFLVDDIITEVYGYRAARSVIWLGFAANLFFVSIATLVGICPPASFWDGQAAYVKILGYTPRLLASAFLSYLIGNFANAITMSRMKIYTKGHALWARTILSTVIGQGLDSLIFITLAFGGTVVWIHIGHVVLTVWLFKSLYEILMTPVVYHAVKHLKLIERCDVYDHKISYNPFSFF